MLLSSCKSISLSFLVLILIPTNHPPYYGFLHIVWLMDFTCEANLILAFRLSSLFLPLKSANVDVSTSSDVAHLASVLKMLENRRIHPVGLRPPPLKRGILSLPPSEGFLVLPKASPSFRRFLRPSEGFILALLYLNLSNLDCFFFSFFAL